MDLVSPKSPSIRSRLLAMFLSLQATSNATLVCERGRDHRGHHRRAYVKDLVQVKGRADQSVHFDERGEALDLVVKTGNICRTRHGIKIAQPTDNGQPESVESTDRSQRSRRQITTSDDRNENPYVSKFYVCRLDICSPSSAFCPLRSRTLSTAGGWE